MDDDGHRVGRFEHHLAGRSEQCGVIRRREAEVAHQSGQHHFDLEHSVLLSDAVARSGAERNESVRMSSDAVLRKEAFRFEVIGIGIDARVVVHSVE